MTDLPPDSGTGEGRDGEPTVGAPRWARVFGIIALVVVLLLAILMLTGGGGHGPGRHSGGPGEGTPSSRVAEHRPPAGGHTSP